MYHWDPDFIALERVLASTAMCVNALAFVTTELYHHNHQNVILPEENPEGHDHEMEKFTPEYRNDEES